MYKRRGSSLGVRFYADASAHDGAVIEAVEPDGVAWRMRLRAGDAVRAVRVLNTGVVHTLRSGYDAARVLRPASGVLLLRVDPRPWTAADGAAARLQAAWLGRTERAAQRARRAAAVVVQAHWRRCEAMDAAHDLRLDAAEDAAVLLLQSHWRRVLGADGAWVRRLALEHVQARARGMAARARARRARAWAEHAAAHAAACGAPAAAAEPKRQRIRSPAFLDHGECDNQRVLGEAPKVELEEFE